MPYVRKQIKTKVRVQLVSKEWKNDKVVEICFLAGSWKRWKFWKFLPYEIYLIECNNEQEDFLKAHMASERQISLP
jgi:hypothetical protein